MTTNPRLIPDSQVAARYSVTLRTLARWDQREGLNFPAPVRINKRKYRPIEQLDDWDKLNSRRVAEVRTAAASA